MTAGQPPSGQFNPEGVGVDARGVPQFDRQFFEGHEEFTRIGSGALGGKAQGLFLIRERILSGLELSEFQEITVNVPRLTVLTTEVFDAFMAKNRLWEVVAEAPPDDRLAHAFQIAELPANLVGDLRALIAKIHVPLAVRSSSLLEDALAHPFAGVYATKMIPNNQPDADTRFRKLTEAIKFVFASTFFAEARSTMKSVGTTVESEKMAVILQEIVGQRRDERFYPNLSGVARSYNYYPTGHAQPTDGVVNLALGLGKTIVDGGLSWTYSPAFPKSPPPYNSINDLLKNTQTEFWAVHMGQPPAYDPIRETEYLRQLPLETAECDDCLKFVASTYDGASDRINPGISAPGPRLLNFAPILTWNQIPLNDLLRKLLRRSEEVLGTEIEMEFAATIDARRGLPARFGFLQVRPMAVSNEQVQISQQDLRADGVIAASTHVLGNGSLDTVRDVVFLKPEVFSPEFTPLMATELEQVNQALVSEGRPYLLIGFGRWGSSDPWLGVPVNWGQISGVKAIVEATLPKMSPDLSQGSHFFHNLIGFRVFYLSIPHAGEFPVDWDWLNRQPVVAETRFVKHVRGVNPLRIRVDGRSGRGVICRHDRTQ